MLTSRQTSARATRWRPTTNAIQATSACVGAPVSRRTCSPAINNATSANTTHQNRCPYQDTHVREPPGAAEPQPFTCHGPSDSLNFKDHGRDFQVEVYLGPAANPATRTQMLAILDSFHAGPNA